MLKKSRLIKRINLQGKSTQQWVRDKLDIYGNELKNKIQYSEYRMSPSWMGVKAYIYSVNIDSHFNIECEIRDRKTPNLSKSYSFKYCALNIYWRKNSTRVYHFENSQIIMDICLRMYKMHKLKNR